MRELVISPTRRLLLHREMIDELESRVLQVLDRLHEQFPLMSGHDRQKVQSQLDYVGDESLVHATADRLIQRKQLTGDLRRIARADFKPKLSGNLRTVWHLENSALFAQKILKDANRLEVGGPRKTLGQRGGIFAEVHG